MIDPIALAILAGLAFAAFAGFVIVFILPVLSAYDLHLDQGDDF